MLFAGVSRYQSMPPPNGAVILGYRVTMIAFYVSIARVVEADCRPKLV
jgi:hypothetical protein